jgi:hypothetical protein
MVEALRVNEGRIILQAVSKKYEYGDAVECEQNARHGIPPVVVNEQSLQILKYF